MKNNKGFSMLEVLIALVIFSIGMLGTARMLFVTHQADNANYVKHIAIQSAYNILDRVRTNRTMAIQGQYTASNIPNAGDAPVVPNAPGTICTNSTCNAQALAAYDTWYWMANELAALPSGCGSIITTAAGLSTRITVTVQWDDSITQKKLGNPAPDPAQFVLETQL